MVNGYFHGLLNPMIVFWSITVLSKHELVDVKLNV